MSTLLYHIVQTYEDRVNQTNSIVAAYLSLQQTTCRNPASFYTTVAAEFLQLPKVKFCPELAEPLRVQPFDRVAFAEAVRAWKAAGVLMVLCLDDFEELLDRTDVFDNDFYDCLRSIVSDRGFVLVLASRQKLVTYTQKKKLTSDFFNIFETLRLPEFDESEARDLVRLPHPDSPALGEEKQTLALKWGGRHPKKLQIAGHNLWLARHQDRSQTWAQQQFEEQIQGIPRKLEPMKQLFWGIGRLGRLGQNIGDTADDWGNFFKGAFILILLGLALTGAAKWQDIQDWVRGTTQEARDNFE